MGGIMGLFDSIYINKRFFKENGLDENFSRYTWQTKDLGSWLETHYLNYDAKGNLRLYHLEKPNKKYFVKYTKEEIEEHNKVPSFFALFKRKQGDGYYKPEGYFPENRKYKPMGVLPHGYVNLIFEHKLANREKSLCIDLKFTDGIVESYKIHDC